MGRHVTIPVFVPHKGCPFDCIFCNQKKISGQQKEPTLSEVKENINEHLASIKPDTEVEIGFFGGSFTGIERNYQLSLLETAFEYVKNGSIKALRLSTRPDYINEEILEYLLYYGVKTIELGVQSLDDSVLQKSCRGHSSADVYEASRLIQARGINLVLQTMVGLPGDDRRKALETARKIVDINPVAVRIYPTLVIKNTYLEVLYKEGRYTPMSLEEAVDLCMELLLIYRSSGIAVIRLGLQATDHISEGADVIIGPFHPAFGHMVESRLTLRRIEELLQGIDYKDKDTLVILTSQKNLSNVTGQKKCNIKLLKTRYGFSDVLVKADGTIHNGIRVTIRPDPEENSAMFTK